MMNNNTINCYYDGQQRSRLPSAINGGNPRGITEE